ncbi:unnamed protein product [Rhizophagus irregularis]|nr:unnamed protein product [Rhizophagus irregularis]
MPVFFIEASFLKNLQWKSFWLRFTKRFIPPGLHYYSWTIYDIQYQVDLLAWLPYGVIHFTLPFLQVQDYGGMDHQTLNTKTFSGSPMVFGAFPSLHSGCAIIQALFISHVIPKSKPFGFAYVMWIWNRWEYIKEKNSVLLTTDNINDNDNLLFDSSKFNNNDEYEIEIATTISEGTDLAALTNSESSSKSNTSIDTIGQSFHEIKLHSSNL